MRSSRVCRANRVGLSGLPFPATLSGLAFWFQAELGYTDATILGTTVGVWTDRFAGKTFTQANNTLKGTLTAISGANFLVLDAVDDGYAGTGSLTGSYSLMVHGIKGTSAAAARRTLVSPTVNALLSLTNRLDVGRWFLAGSVDGTVDAAGVGRITVGLTVAAGGAVKAYLDGVDVTSGAPATAADWGTVNLAASGTNGEQADASVRHVVGYQGTVLSAAQMLALHTYLSGS